MAARDYAMVTGGGLTIDRPSARSWAWRGVEVPVHALVAGIHESGAQTTNSQSGIRVTTPPIAMGEQHD